MNTQTEDSIRSEANAFLDIYDLFEMELGYRRPQSRSLDSNSKIALFKIFITRMEGFE